MEKDYDPLGPWLLRADSRRGRAPLCLLLSFSTGHPNYGFHFFHDIERLRNASLRRQRGVCRHVPPHPSSPVLSPFGPGKTGGAHPPGLRSEVPELAA